MKMQHKKFRSFTTSSQKLVISGKNAKQNEEVVAQAKDNEIVLHTKVAGSPFCNINGKATKKDIYEAALFCASYSRDWKKKEKDVVVHVFFGKDIYKDKDMKLGTFGVKKFKIVRAEKIDIKKFILKKQKSKREI